MSEKQERLQVLEMVENGVITAEEGARLLRLLDDSAQMENSVAESDVLSQRVEAEDRQADSAPPQSIFEERIEKLKRWWQIPLWIGVGITILGGLLMFLAYQASGISFWFGCAWLPFLLGVMVMAIAWGSRTARWLHLRIQQEPGELPQTISLSFPLPLRFTSLALRTFGHFIPDLKEQGVNVTQVIQAIEASTSSDTPFFVEVDEGEGKEKVLIYIG